MNDFKSIMVHVIKRYQRHIKRRYEPAEARVRLSALGIKGAISEDPCQLHGIGHKIVEAVEYDHLQQEGASAYSGLEDFCLHLRQFLAHYHIEGNRVVHRERKVAKMIVQVIQWCRYGVSCLETMCDDINAYSRYIAQYGAAEQRALYHDHLVYQANTQQGVFIRLLQQYSGYIES